MGQLVPRNHTRRLDAIALAPYPPPFDTAHKPGLLRASGVLDPRTTEPSQTPAGSVTDNTRLLQPPVRYKVHDIAFMHDRRQKHEIR